MDVLDTELVRVEIETVDVSDLELVRVEVGVGLGSGETGIQIAEWFEFWKHVVPTGHMRTDFPDGHSSISISLTKGGRQYVPPHMPNRSNLAQKYEGS